MIYYTGIVLVGELTDSEACFFHKDSDTVLHEILNPTRRELTKMTTAPNSDGS